MSNPIVAMTTTSLEQEAKTLAHLLVSEKLAACVQIIPKINSIYKWKGSIHDDEEYLILIKTLDKHVEAIKKAIAKNHSYEVPEFIVLPVIDGAETYLKWMGKTVG